jgi:hypothetical protein
VGLAAASFLAYRKKQVMLTAIQYFLATDSHDVGLGRGTKRVWEDVD